MPKQLRQDDAFGARERILRRRKGARRFAKKRRGEFGALRFAAIPDSAKTPRRKNEQCACRGRNVPQPSGAGADCATRQADERECNAPQTHGRDAPESPPSSAKGFCCRRPPPTKKSRDELQCFFHSRGGGRFRVWQFKFSVGLALQIVVGMRQRGQRIHGDRRTIERIGERLRHRARQAQARKLSRSRAERKGGAVGQLQVGFLQKARNKRQRNFGMGAGVRGKLAYLAAATQRRRKKRAAGFHRQDCGH